MDCLWSIHISCSGQPFKYSSSVLLQPACPISLSAFFLLATLTLMMHPLYKSLCLPNICTSYAHSTTDTAHWSIHSHQSPLLSKWRDCPEIIAHLLSAAARKPYRQLCSAVGSLYRDNTWKCIVHYKCIVQPLQFYKKLGFSYSSPLLFTVWKLRGYCS